MHYLFKRIALLLIFFALSESVHAQDDLALGKEALQQKSYDTAINDFVKAQKAAPRVLETNFYLGEAYRLKGVKDSAEFFFCSALLISTKHTFRHGHRWGHSLIKTSQWDKVAKVFGSGDESRTRPARGFSRVRERVPSMLIRLIKQSFTSRKRKN